MEEKVVWEIVKRSMYSESEKRTTYKEKVQSAILG